MVTYKTQKQYFSVCDHGYQLQPASPSNHLRRELSLLLGDGGAEGRAFGDPVGLDSPEIHEQMYFKYILSQQGATYSC